MSATTPPAFDADLPDEIPPTRWPKIIGIICLVLGAFGALGGLCGAIGMVASKSLAKMAEGQPAGPGGGPTPAELIELSTKHQGLMIVLCIVAMLMGGVLIYGGIRLINRRANSRKVLLTWAAIKVVETIGGTWVGFLSAKDQMALHNRYAEAGGPSGSTAALFSTIALVAGFLMGVSLPIFLGIWLNRPAIKDEAGRWG